MSNICIVIRGDLLRKSTSCYSKQIRGCDLLQSSFNRQNDIMQSIIDKIITPYQNNGYNVYISGCVYNCPAYTNKLLEYFPYNTIKQIEPDKNINVSRMFYLGLEHAEEQHPNCKEYISVRGDFIMLRDVIISEPKNDLYVKLAWRARSKSQPGRIDVFFVISKKAMVILKKVLFEDTRACCQLHGLSIVLDKMGISIYFIWKDYCHTKAGFLWREVMGKNNKLRRGHGKRPLTMRMR